jgi:hypothetical protein
MNARSCLRRSSSAHRSSRLRAISVEAALCYARSHRHDRRDHRLQVIDLSRIFNAEIQLSQAAQAEMNFYNRKQK